jgi:hypothetical protein
MALTRRARLVFCVSARKGIAVLIADRTRQYHGTRAGPPLADDCVPASSYRRRFRSFILLVGMRQSVLPLDIPDPLHPWTY